MDKTREFFAKFKTDIDKLKTEIPDTLQGFGGLFQKVMKDGALTVKEKELIALGIGVASHCPPCIRSHVQKCLEARSNKAADSRSGIGISCYGGRTCLRSHTNGS